ncbi:MAG TPA: phage holin family protein [Chloroflexota bacterium]|nr:phage holin family protein [Chloroflexota bacterium]
MRLVLKWLLSAVALIIVAKLVPGIHVTIIAALIAAIVIGIINAILRPIVTILTLPLTLITFGLFVFVINALLFWLAAVIVPHFSVHGFLAALIGSIVYGLLGWAVTFIVERIG